MTSFGIDFGTTNSVLAVANGAVISTVELDEPPGDWAGMGFGKVLPSVIGLAGGDITYGWRAKQQQVDKLQAVKRLLASPNETVKLGGAEFPLEQLAASLFRRIQTKATDAGLTLDRAVVTVPANSRGNARLRTKIAAGLAGIEVMALINEPTAAAMAYARSISEGERVLVYDFGGGTLDVTVLRLVQGVFMEEASKGIGKLGGIDIDQAYAAAVLARAGMEQPTRESELSAVMSAVERSKILLSSEDSDTVLLPGDRVAHMTRRDFEEAAAPLIQRSADPIRTCLSDLAGNVKLDHVVLVGGSSKIPYVRGFVEEIVGVSPLEGVDPMTAIAEGAALASAILNDELEEFDFFVGTEHALGTIVLNPATNESEFSVLIPRNNMLPAKKTDFYSPTRDNQEAINVEVIEGDPELPLDHDDNVILKSWSVKLPEERSRDEASVAITYEYDVDGILHVLVVDVMTSAVLMDETLSFGAKQDLAQMKRDLDGMADAGAELRGSTGAAPTASALDAESQALVDKVMEKIHPFVDETEQAKLEGIIADLEIASPATLEEAKRRLGAAMREHAYLL